MHVSCISRREGRFLGLARSLRPATLTLDEMRAICAAALMRVPDHRQQGISEARPLYEQIDLALAAIRLNQGSAGEVAKAA